MTNAEVSENPVFQMARELGSIHARHNPASARRAAAGIMAREIKTDNPVFAGGFAVGIVETIGMGNYHAECKRSLRVN